jgi:hypothetical protein
MEEEIWATSVSDSDVGGKVLTRPPRVHVLHPGLPSLTYIVSLACFLGQPGFASLGALFNTLNTHPPQLQIFGLLLIHQLLHYQHFTHP